MPLGNSGGRSAGNRQGQGAARKNTPRERSAIDPVFPDGPPEIRFAQQHDDTAWVDSLMLWVAWISAIACGVLFGLVLAAWFGVI